VDGFEGFFVFEKKPEFLASIGNRQPFSNGSITLVHFTIQMNIISSSDISKLESPVPLSSIIKGQSIK
jgi:hypothetical protein